MTNATSRPLTTASLRVLSLVARHGIYLWAPGSVAVLDDPWRSSVHAGSVASLIKKGMLAPIGEFEVGATTAGLQALQTATARDEGQLSVTIANTSVTVVISKLDRPEASRQAAQRMVDSFRIVAQQDPRAWESMVDLALAGRENPPLSGIAAQVLESMELDDTERRELELEVELRFMPVGPRRK